MLLRGLQSNYSILGMLVEVTGVLISPWQDTNVKNGCCFIKLNMIKLKTKTYVKDGYIEFFSHLCHPAYSLLRNVMSAQL